MTRIREKVPLISRNHICKFQDFVHINNLLYSDNFNSKNRPDSVRKYKNDSPLRKNDKPAYKNDDIFNAPRSGYYFEVRIILVFYLTFEMKNPN